MALTLRVRFRRLSTIKSALHRSPKRSASSRKLSSSDPFPIKKYAITLPTDTHTTNHVSMRLWHPQSLLILQYLGLTWVVALLLMLLSPLFCRCSCYSCVVVTVVLPLFVFLLLLANNPHRRRFARVEHKRTVRTVLDCASYVAGSRSSETTCLSQPFASTNSPHVTRLQ